MAKIERDVARQLLRAHHDDWGTVSSSPKLQTPLFSETIQVRLEDAGVEIEHGSLVIILRDLASQDYITVVPDAGGAPDALKVTKVFPARLKRDFNLWNVMEDE
ncbi:MAG TPA: hypothetical protein VJ183_20225 [Chloroflexia bacterium]|nr:hypothetical protein [Chloroflexia bacterium]